MPAELSETARTFRVVLHGMKRLEQFFVIAWHP